MINLIIKSLEKLHDKSYPKNYDIQRSLMLMVILLMVVSILRIALSTNSFILSLLIMGILVIGFLIFVSTFYLTNEWCINRKLRKVL